MLFGGLQKFLTLVKPPSGEVRPRHFTFYGFGRELLIKRHSTWMILLRPKFKLKVGDLQRLVDFRPILVLAGMREGQQIEMQLLQCKRKRGLEYALIQINRVDCQTGNSTSQAMTVFWVGTMHCKSIDPNPNFNFEFQKGRGETSSDHEHLRFDEISDDYKVVRMVQFISQEAGIQICWTTQKFGF